MFNAIKDPLEKFLKTALQSKNQASVDKAFQEQRFVLCNDVMFYPSDLFIQERGVCVKAILKKIGSDPLSEEEIVDLLHSCAAETQKEEDIASSVKAFSKKISETANIECKYIIRNHSILLDRNVDQFQMGKVKCIHTQNLNNENLPIHQQITVTDTSSPQAVNFSEKGMNIEVGLTKQCFVITLCASPKNVAPRANWYADVALSLIRLLYIQANIRTDFFPRIGEIDPLPFEQNDGENKALIVTSNKTSHCGGKSIPPVYQITSEFKAWFDKSESTKTCNKIFEGKSGTVAERMQRALGWMTRARSSLSREERFLLLFTALEGLLTHSDKDSPVTETIARNVSTILTTPENRFYIYKKMKELYGIRSSIVHSGKREVSKTDCNQLQFYTELTCLEIIKHSLDQATSDFQEGLKKAGFGEVWPQERTQ